jgi:hypothetical protein
MVNVQDEHSATIDAGNPEPVVNFISLQHEGIMQAGKPMMVC